MQGSGSDRGTGNPDDTATAPPSTAPLPSWLVDLARLGGALGRLAGAQWSLLATELGLARSAVSWMLLAGLVATVAGVALALTLMALLGLALAKWFGSWLWALLALCVLQLLMLAGAVWLFRRCMHWMTLPATRGEWSAMMHDAMRGARQGEAPAGAASTRGHQQGDDA